MVGIYIRINGAKAAHDGCSIRAGHKEGQIDNVAPKRGK